MFGNRYFAQRYFADRYFPPGESSGITFTGSGALVLSPIVMSGSGWAVRRSSRVYPQKIRRQMMR